jgi:hypothetical protein
MSSERKISLLAADAANPGVLPHGVGFLLYADDIWVLTAERGGLERSRRPCLVGNRATLPPEWPSSPQNVADSCEVTATTKPLGSGCSNSRGVAAPWSCRTVLEACCVQIASRF